MSQAIAQGKNTVALDNIPQLTGLIDHDISIIGQYAKMADEFIKKIPQKCQRSRHQQNEIDEIHSLSRGLRKCFVHKHAIWIYHKLYEKIDSDASLQSLAYTAADLVPGLVPTEAQIETERTYIQANKEGREIDQGIFFYGLLKEPEVGNDLVKRMLQPTRCARSLMSEWAQNKKIQFKTLCLTLDGNIATITFQNNRYLNAEDDDLIDDLETAIDLVLLCDDAQVGVLRGGVMTHPRYSGKRVFSSGVNLKYLHEGKISLLNFLLRRELGYIHKMLRGLWLGEAVDGGQIEIIEKPWLCAVDSFAIGGGMQLLLVSDMVIAESSSYACLPAAKEGIIPGVANLRLGSMASGRLAKQIILQGRKIWANEAAAEHFFDLVVDAPEMDAAIARCAAQLTAPAVLANRQMLTLANESFDQFREYMAEFALQQSIRLYSEDVLDKVSKL